MLVYAPVCPRCAGRHLALCSSLPASWYQPMGVDAPHGDVDDKGEKASFKKGRPINSRRGYCSALVGSPGGKTKLRSGKPRVHALRDRKLRFGAEGAGGAHSGALLFLTEPFKLVGVSCV